MPDFWISTDQGDLRAGRSGNHGSIPDKEQIYFFSKESSPALGPTRPRIQWAPGLLSPGVTRPRREAGYSSHLKPGLRMNEVTPPYPHTLSWRQRNNFTTETNVQEGEADKMRRHVSERIWHSEDRASWYILIIKPTRCTNFSNLFLE